MKYCILTFGCRANQADSCRLDADLQGHGAVPVTSEAADVVVVNTCTVTASADRAARNAILRIARTNPSVRIVATGCYASRDPDGVGKLPGVSSVAPNPEKGGIVRRLFEAQPREARCPRPGDRGRTAYPLLVQSGCDEHCAYCIVPSTRGPSRSRPVESMIDEVRQVASAGFREAWVTGVHLGAYGRDLDPRSSLLDLLTALGVEALPSGLRFRLSSIEPMDCDDRLIEHVALSPAFLPHLHLPLQHASDRVLAAMRRSYTLDRFRSTVDGVRRRMPDAAIGSDILVGFPGETEADFEHLVRYLPVSPLTHVHVFPYSDRPGTASSTMGSKVPTPVVRERAERLRALAREQMTRFVRRFVGTTRPALTLADGSLALTDNYLKVSIPPGHGRNERVTVRLLSTSPLRGEVVS
jgi:threonylcarbamoyladenosine tRNA methylthiotransferase MtaB